MPMHTYKRFEGESDDALIFRITGEKDKIGSWQDVADILNDLLGTNYTSSAFRKKRQYFDVMFKANESKWAESQEQIDKLEQKILEMKVERQKTQAINVELNKNLRKQSRFELFYENVAKEISAFEVPQFEYHNRMNNSKEYVIALTDIHCGANFSTDTNSYSFEEMKKRFETLYCESVKFVREKELDRIKVLCLGDVVQGLIRLNDLSLNESSVVHATVLVAQTIAEFLNSLSVHCHVDYYHTPSANHSQVRYLNSKASELASEDVEYVVGNYIKDVLVRNPRVEVHTNFGYDYIEMPIFDFDTIALHGHTINNIESALKDLSFHKKKFYSTVFMGHFHAGKSITVGQLGNATCEVVICPSFVGDCPYSDKIMKGAKAASCIYGFDKEYGLTETYKIILN